jgi:hypothetical protein
LAHGARDEPVFYMEFTATPSCHRLMVGFIAALGYILRRAGGTTLAPLKRDLLSVDWDFPWTSASRKSNA